MNRSHTAITVTFVCSVLFNQSAIAQGIPAQPQMDSGLQSPVTQGMLVTNDSTGSECTIGWVTAGRAYTAGHCGSTGDTMTINGATHGTFTQEGTPSKLIADRGYIEIGNIPYSNPTTRDTTVAPEDISPGETICITPRSNPKAQCGKVLRVVEEAVIASPAVAAQFGDSGSPAWIPGRGLVGLYNGVQRRADGSIAAVLITHPTAPFHRTHRMDLLAIADDSQDSDERGQIQEETVTYSSALTGSDIAAIVGATTTLTSILIIVAHWAVHAFHLLQTSTC